jgi:hypothetical protein
MLYLLFMAEHAHTESLRDQPHYDVLFFNMQCRFAQVACKNNNYSYAQSLAEDTCLMDLFRLLPDDSDSENIWHDFIAHLPSNVSEHGTYAHAFYEARTRNARPLDSFNGGRTKWFGWASHPNNVVSLHFLPAQDVSLRSAISIREDLKTVILNIKQTAPHTRFISLHSWFLGEKGIQLLLPATMSRNIRESDELGISSLEQWGQFLAATGKTKTHLAQSFFESLRNFEKGGAIHQYQLNRCTFRDVFVRDPVPRVL